MSIERNVVIQHNVMIDIYDGFDRPKFFESYHEGDTDTNNHKDDIVIKLSELPPGAKVSIEYPECPDCGQVRQDKSYNMPIHIANAGFEETCDCGFDWVDWETNQFS